MFSLKFHNNVELEDLTLGVEKINNERQTYSSDCSKGANQNICSYLKEGDEIQRIYLRQMLVEALD